MIGACVVVAAAPPLGFSLFIDAHVQASAQQTLADYAGRMTGRVETMMRGGIAVLAELHDTDVSACDLRGREAMRRAVAASRVIREIAVVGPDGQCASSPVASRYAILSEHVPVNATISVFVTRDEQGRRALAMRFQPTPRHRLTTYFLPESIGLDVLPAGWRQHGLATLAVDDGTVFEAAPEETELAEPLGEGVIIGKRASERFPVTGTISVAKAAVMDDYAGLRAYTFAVMALFAGLVTAIAATFARRHSRLSDDIAAGLSRGEFVPYYQPVLDVASGRLIGCEVLVRRRRRDGTIESPAHFIAQAELDGQIVDMTVRLMHGVIADLGEHYARHGKLKVGFNLCAQHFQDDTIIRDVKRIFANSPIAMHQLIFEVTERFPLVDMARAKTVIAKLQALGAKVALDDAGTGHSGLAALHRLGMDIVKIDKVFIDPITAETTEAPIVDSLVELAKSYEMSVVAEGVETLDQLRYLRGKGVDAAQGYLFAPPLPASSYISLVEALQKRSARRPTNRTGSTAPTIDAA